LKVKCKDCKLASTIFFRCRSFCRTQSKYQSNGWDPNFCR